MFAATVNAGDAIPLVGAGEFLRFPEERFPGHGVSAAPSRITHGQGRFKKSDEMAEFQDDVGVRAASQIERQIFPMTSSA